jgi:hypothetical protein
MGRRLNRDEPEQREESKTEVSEVDQLLKKKLGNVWGKWDLSGPKPTYSKGMMVKFKYA